MSERDRPIGQTLRPTTGELPGEFTALDEAVEGGLAVGAAGKLGILDLTLGERDGVTRVLSHYQRAPLHIYRPIYLDPRRPGMAFIFLQQSGDGLVQGDRYRIDIDCHDGAAVHVTTQAATKVFAARQNYVTQTVNLRAGAGSVLEYLPDPVVPFRASRLYQRTDVIADPQSTVLLADTLLPGRVAHAEAHAYDVYWAETEVRRPDGAPLFTDFVRFQPGTAADPRSSGLLGSYDVLATLYVICSRMDPAAVVSLLRSALPDQDDVLVGVSELPNGCGAAVRVLGRTSKAAQRAVQAAWSTARLELLGAPAPDLRKG